MGRKKITEEQVTRFAFKTEDFDRLMSEFSIENVSFPKRADFKSWINNLEEKTSGKFNLVNDVTAKCKSVKEYWKEVLNNTNYANRSLPSTRVVEPIVRAAQIFVAEKSFLSKEEICFIMMVKFMRIHCAVLYRSDLCDDGKKDGVFNNVTVTCCKAFGTMRFETKVVK